MRIFYLSLILLLFSCASFFFVHEPPDIDESTLLVYFGPYSNCTVTIRSTPNNLFGNGNNDSLIINYFRANILKELKSKYHFKAVDLYQDSINLNFVRDSILSKNKTTLSSSSFKLSNCNADIVLFIYDIIVDSSATKNSWEDVSFTTNSLNFKNNFIFWNNKSNQILSYGHLTNSSTNPYEGLTLKNWENIIKSIVKNLMNTLKNPNQG
jgi:hypothetical protein